MDVSFANKFMARMFPNSKQNVLSETYLSNVQTMGMTSKASQLQTIPTETYALPSLEVRRLRAQLIAEEAIETINALGFSLEVNQIGTVFKLVPEYKPDLFKIIDGCCDVNYVIAGTMLSMGVPDLPHQREVNLANFLKFNKGVIVNPTGKFQKPINWNPPYHQMIAQGQHAMSSGNNDYIRKDGGQVDWPKEYRLVQAGFNEYKSAAVVSKQEG